MGQVNVETTNVDLLRQELGFLGQRMSQQRIYVIKTTESKAAMSLQILQSEKIELKQWNERLTNAFSALWTPAREFFVELNRSLDINRKELTEHEVNLLFQCFRES